MNAQHMAKIVPELNYLDVYKRQPFEKVFIDTLKLFMAITGKVNFLQMGRYGEFSEQDVYKRQPSRASC